MKRSYGICGRLKLPRPAFSPAFGSCQWTWSGVSCMQARMSEKRQGADLDALARARMRRRGRVLERGVRAPARAAVFERVEHLEHQRLVAPHAREPVPAVR